MNPLATLMKLDVYDVTGALGFVLFVIMLIPVSMLTVVWCLLNLHRRDLPTDPGL